MQKGTHIKNGINYSGSSNIQQEILNVEDIFSNIQNCTFDDFSAVKTGKVVTVNFIIVPTVQWTQNTFVKLADITGNIPLTTVICYGIKDVDMCQILMGNSANPVLQVRPQKYAHPIGTRTQASFTYITE